MITQQELERKERVNPSIRDALSKKNHYFEITKKQIHNLIDLAKIGQEDIFYDIGCGTGLVVQEAITYGKAKKSTGVEVDKYLYDVAKERILENLDKKNLKKIDFWLGFYKNDDRLYDNGKLIFDYSDATVIYNSIDYEGREIDFYKKRTNVKKCRIIKKDFPFISYQPEAVNRKDSDCWFFMMKFPLTKVRSKDKWASLILGKPNVTIDDFYEYCFKQLNKRFTLSDTRNSLKKIKYMVRRNF